MPVFNEVDKLLGECGLLRQSVATGSVAAASMTTAPKATAQAFTARPLGKAPGILAKPKVWLVAADDVWYLERDEAEAMAAKVLGFHVEPVVPGLSPDVAEAHAVTASAQAETAATVPEAAESDRLKLDLGNTLQSVAEKRDIETAKDVDGVGGQGLRTISFVDGKPVVALWPGVNMDNAPGGKRTNRVLVLVHGTFSSTQSLVDNFLDCDGNCAGDGVALLKDCADTYRAIIGFTHYTRSVTPDVNARLLAQELQGLLANLQSNPAWDGPPELHFIVHSRGGLVVRSLLELLTPAEVPFLNLVKSVIFVATPNAGTNLALPQNWGRMAGALAKVTAPWASLMFKELVIMAGSHAESDWPGVDCMEPGGQWLKANLYNGHKPESIQYYSVSGDYKPAEWGLFKALKHWFFDALFRVANDTVVDTESVTGQTLVPGKLHDTPVGYLLPLTTSLLITDGKNKDVATLADRLRHDNVQVYLQTMEGVDHSGYFRTAPFREYAGGILLHA